jgi:hypothetical protein
MGLQERVDDGSADVADPIECEAGLELGFETPPRVVPAVAAVAAVDAFAAEASAQPLEYPLVPLMLGPLQLLPAPPPDPCLHMLVADAIVVKKPAWNRLKRRASHLASSLAVARP